jgi:microsomal dipeptidase-like Zn-dependent dipeptidase
MLRISRRRFLLQALLSSTGLITLYNPHKIAGYPGRQTSEVSPAAKRSRFFADLHVHATLRDWNFMSPLAKKYPFFMRVFEGFMNPTKVDWKKCHSAGIDMMCIAHYNAFDELFSMPTDPSTEAPLHTRRMLDLLEKELEGPLSPYAKFARNHIQLRSLLKKSKSDPDYRIAVIHSLEGAHALGGSIDTLKELARRGVALITLTHFFNKGITSTANPFHFFPDSESSWPHQGLSEFGREVIKEMENLGILVDVIHSTSRAISDILCIANKPLVATHSSARTLADHAYSLFDEHIQEIAWRGGIIGVLLYPYVLSNYSGLKAAEKYGSLRDIVRTVRYITKICGNHKCVGISSDYSGYIHGPKEVKSLDEIGKLYDLLLKEFDNDKNIVEDIMANNVIDFFLKNWRSGL